MGNAQMPSLSISMGLPLPLQFRASFLDNLRKAGCKGDPRDPEARLAKDKKLIHSLQTGLTKLFIGSQSSRCLRLDFYLPPVNAWQPSA